MALRLGADIVVDPANEDVAGVLRAHGIRRVSTVIECCGLKSTIAQALELVGDKGTVMIFGLTKPDDAVEIKPFSLFQKETTVRASYINPYTMGRAVTLINAKRIDVSSMVADRIALEKLRQFSATQSCAEKANTSSIRGTERTRKNPAPIFLGAG
jgi:threonine dehydrogenase-like Zn-dependent dehydrogenase